MPRPRLTNQQRLQQTIAHGTCECGDPSLYPTPPGESQAGWLSNEQRALSMQADIAEMREFWASLKEPAKAVMTKLGAPADIIPQLREFVMNSTSLSTVAMPLVSNPKAMAAIAGYFRQLLDANSSIMIMEGEGETEGGFTQCAHIPLELAYGKLWDAPNEAVEEGSADLAQQESLALLAFGALPADSLIEIVPGKKGIVRVDGASPVTRAAALAATSISGGNSTELSAAAASDHSINALDAPPSSTPDDAGSGSSAASAAAATSAVEATEVPVTAPGTPVNGMDDIDAAGLETDRLPQLVYGSADEAVMAWVAEMHESGQCMPAKGLHFRPWSGEGDMNLFMQALEQAGVVVGVLTLYQRRLLKALQRAQLVRAAVSSASNGGAATAVDSSSPQVWVWGSGSSGQLGLGATTSVPSPQPLPALAGRGINYVSVSSHHTFAVSDRGDVVSFGHGSSGVLGSGETAKRLHPQPLELDFTIGNGTSTNRVHALSTGRTHTLALVDGIVWAWGAAWMGQLGNTSHFRLGREVAVFNPKEHETLTRMVPPTMTQFMTSRKARLPPGVVQDGLQAPKPHSPVSAVSFVALPVLYPSGGECACCPGDAPGAKPFDGVTAIAAGGLHSVAIQHGQVYAWGCNEMGSLGVDIPQDLWDQPWVHRAKTNCGACPVEHDLLVGISIPMPVNLLNCGVRGAAVDVACGDAISVARTVHGEVVSWGAPLIDPWRVDPLFPQGEVGCSITAGGSYCMATTSPSGLLFVWRRDPLETWGAHTGRPSVQQVPFLHDVVSTACSDTHGVALCGDGRVYAWPIEDSALKTESGDGGVYEVESLRGQGVTQVACGEDFLIAVRGPKLPAGRKPPAVPASPPSAGMSASEAFEASVANHFAALSIHVRPDDRDARGPNSNTRSGQRQSQPTRGSGARPASRQASQVPSNGGNRSSGSRGSGGGAANTAKQEDDGFQSRFGPAMFANLAKQAAAAKAAEDASNGTSGGQSSGSYVGAASGNGGNASLGTPSGVASETMKSRKKTKAKRRGKSLESEGTPVQAEAAAGGTEAA